MADSCKFCGKTDGLERTEAYGWLCETCVETAEMDEMTAALDEGSDDF